MALFLSLVIPDYLAGVIAVRGYLPDLAGWPIDTRDMNNLPILLIHDSLDTPFPAALHDATAERLSTVGAKVTKQQLAGANALGDDLKAIVRGWLSEQGVSSNGKESVSKAI